MFFPRGETGLEWFASGGAMIQRIALVVVLLISCLSSAEKNPKAGPLPSGAELAAITARGRMLEEYDVAAWHATDAVEELKPDKSVAPLYIARKTENEWEVAFGRLNERQDAFLIVYQASPGAGPTEFTVKKADPPIEDHSFYLAAAKAIQTASRDFGKPGRPYNTYVLPTENAHLYVYLLPAQTVNGIYPLGGDVRYTIAADGNPILEKRQMHKTILEFNLNDPDKKKGSLVSSYHTHVLSNLPEDSDVFYVLSRKPLIPEYIGTMDKKIFVVQVDGTILIGK
jgi:hypothetical protein